MLLTRRGQSTAEYAIVVSVIIGAIVAMQLYTKRGMQGKIKDVSDTLAAINDSKFPETELLSGNNAKDGTANMPYQYEPYYTADTTGGAGVSVVQAASSHETHSLGGKFSKTNIDESTTRTGSQKQGGSAAIGNAKDWK